MNRSLRVRFSTMRNYDSSLMRIFFLHDTVTRSRQIAGLTSTLNLRSNILLVLPGHAIIVRLYSINCVVIRCTVMIPAIYKDYLAVAKNYRSGITAAVDSILCNDLHLLPCLAIVCRTLQHDIDITEVTRTVCSSFSKTKKGTIV